MLNSLYIFRFMSLPLDRKPHPFKKLELSHGPPVDDHSCGSFHCSWHIYLGSQDAEMALLTVNVSNSWFNLKHKFILKACPDSWFFCLFSVTSFKLLWNPSCPLCLIQTFHHIITCILQPPREHWPPIRYWFFCVWACSHADLGHTEASRDLVKNFTALRQTGTFSAVPCEPYHFIQGPFF